MNHPHRDEWIPYLYGELDAAQRKRLKIHLRQCRECRTQVSSWQRTAQRLDSWQIPQPRRSTWIPSFLKAAALVFLTLSIGVGLGRTYVSPPPETAALKAQVSARSLAAMCG